jgi:hypothetical protein
MCRGTAFIASDPEKLVHITCGMEDAGKNSGKPRHEGLIAVVGLAHVAPIVARCLRGRMRTGLVQKQYGAGWCRTGA